MSVILSYDRAQGSTIRRGPPADRLRDVAIRPTRKSLMATPAGQHPGRYGREDAAECWRTFVQS